MQPSNRRPERAQGRRDLAARDLRQLFTKEWLDCETRYRNDRPKFASGVAEALIKVGVRCVIAAGWAVEDTQAMVFARTFYEQLLDQHRFIDAVASARAAAWRLRKAEKSRPSRT